MTKRQEKVSSLLMREISSYLVRERIDAITGLLTVTSVDVSADLGSAKVYVSVVGQDTHEVLEILKTYVHEIQRMLNKKLVMKHVPRIEFRIDDTGEYADHISKVIKKLHDDKPDNSDSI